MSAGGEYLGGHESGLGLPSARGLLDDEQARQTHGAGGPERARLNVGGSGSLGQVEAAGEQSVGIGALVAGPPRRGDLQTRQAGGHAKRVGLGCEQARTVVVEGQQREIGLGRGDPVRDDDQSRQLDEEVLGPRVPRPVGEKVRSIGASCDEVEEFVAGGVPRLILAEEVLMPVVVGGESRRGGWDAVMGADDGGEGLGGFEVPVVLVHEPVLQDQVPSQGVRYFASLEKIDRPMGQSRLLHAIVEALGLDGEGRGALADVVNAGDPGGEQAELLHRGQF